VPGQTKVQVVTRTIQKSFVFKPSGFVDINAEKAKIIIRNSFDNKINLKLSLVSKNPSKELAEKDLKYCYYQVEEKNNGVFISNFFNFKLGKNEISSMLGVKIELEVPKGINLKLRNIYGEIEMTAVQGSFATQVDFGSIRFSNISGTIEISSNCSDISGKDLDAQVKIDAQKADINLDEIYQSISIKNQYGNIKLDNVNAEVTVDAKMTEVSFLVENMKKYSFEVTAICGDIEVPKEFKQYLLHYRNYFISNNKLDSHFITTGKIPVNLKTTYNDITLKQK
jgi:DUF4097 and DUF4098 domain-containing protein YvlB